MKFAHIKHGEQEPWRIKFAWFPVCIYDDYEERNYTVWLERYTEQRTWVIKKRPTKYGPMTRGGWDIKRKMIKEV